MIYKTSNAFDLCRHKNFLPSILLQVANLLECVTEITQSFENAYS